MMALTKFTSMMENAFEELAPHKVCAYIYDLANSFNGFYHDTKIMAEEDKVKQAGYIALLVLTKRVLEDCIDVLGFEAPERMQESRRGSVYVVSHEVGDDSGVKRSAGFALQIRKCHDLRSK